MGHMKRGVGYCENTECEDYAKGVFLLNHGDTFYCPRCRQLGSACTEQVSTSAQLYLPRIGQGIRSQREPRSFCLPGAGTPPQFAKLPL